MEDRACRCERSEDFKDLYDRIYTLERRVDSRLDAIEKKLFAGEFLGKVTMAVGGLVVGLLGALAGWLLNK